VLDIVNASSEIEARNKIDWRKYERLSKFGRKS
jgi:hypothetical protein